MTASAEQVVTTTEESTVPDAALVAARAADDKLGESTVILSMGDLLGVTDATGKAACVITPVNQPLGPGAVSDTFAGDSFYLPSSSSAPG